MEAWAKDVGQGDKRQPMKFLLLIQSSVSFPVLKHQDQSHLGRTGFFLRLQMRGHPEGKSNQEPGGFSSWLAQLTLWNTQGPPGQEWHSHFSRKWPTDFPAGQPDGGNLSVESPSS